MQPSRSARIPSTRLVLQEWHRLADDPTRGKALLFCVSVAHAEFMTAKLNAVAIAAVCVVGSTPADVRRSAPERLARGEIAAIVTCDLFNEGVDLPAVDTLLLLRPTHSPVLFQQQIGRGLRLSPGKESCLILDFVGQHRRGKAAGIEQGRATIKRRRMRTVERIGDLRCRHCRLATQAFVQPVATERGQGFAAVEQDHRGAPVEKRAARIADCPETPAGGGRRKSWPTKK